MTDSTPCPSEDRWGHHVRHCVTPDEAEVLKEHLATCSAWLEKLKRLSVRDELVEAAQQEPEMTLSFHAQGPKVGLLLERLKALQPTDPGAKHGRCYRLNFPHCQNPIGIVDDGSSEDLVCPSCGHSWG